MNLIVRPMLSRNAAFTTARRISQKASPRALRATVLLTAALFLAPQFFPSAARSPQAQGQTQTPAAPPAAAGQTPAQPPAPSQGAQQPPPVPGKITVQVKAVTLYATVRDKKGKIVSNLNKDDFSLQDEDNPQAITYFARESDLPLTLGPLVDTSLSQRRVLDAERDASYAFLDHMLRPDKDKAFLIHFDQEVELLQDLTSSREKLKSAMQELKTPSPEFSNAGGGGGSRGDPDDSGQGGRGGQSRYGRGTLLYDAVFLASDELMKKQQGRKALIILSDGVDHGSKETLEDAIEAAQRADSAVYSVFFPGEEGQDRGGYGHGGYGHGGGMGGRWPGGTGWPGGGGGGGRGRYPESQRPDGKKILQRVSTETGGRFFEVSKKLPIDQIYAQIEEELRNQYSLAFTPSPADSSGTFHKIHLTVKDKDLIVVAREGYYASH